MRAGLYSQNSVTRRQTSRKMVLSRRHDLAYNIDFACDFRANLPNPSVPNAGGSMKFRFAKFAILLFITFCTLSLGAGDAIPKIAWKRAIGEPLANAGTRKPQLN